MRRITWMVAIVMCLAMVVAGCGKKDAGSVVKDLDHVMGKLDSYQGKGTMVLHTGEQPQEYQVEVWFMNPHFYRILLTNAQKDITQIVLRNEEGVFVLTPHLKKSFRFQSDWPENQGQVYLYQSLARSILKDTERHFTTDNDAYVFDVMANYQNEMLARQKIWLSKKDLAPRHVEVTDANQKVMVSVVFSSFEFGKKFEKDSFNMERNMTSWNIETLPTTAGADTKVPNDGTTSSDKQAASANGAKAADPAAGKATDGKQAAGTSTGKAADGKQTASATDSKTADGKQAAGTSTGKAADGKQTASATDSKTADGKQAAGTSTGKAADDKQTAAATGSKTADGKQGTAGTTPGTTGTAAGSQKDAKGTAATTSQQSFGVIEPSYIPKDVVKQDITNMKLGEDPAVLLRYKGKYNYSLIESRPQAKMVTFASGDPVDLGYTLGVLTGGEKKTLNWTYDGVEYRLSTGDMPLVEMMKIAQAVQGQSGK